MSVTRSTLIGGPAYVGFNSKIIQFATDLKLDVPVKWGDIETALYGKLDKIYEDLVLKCSGAPLFYDTAQLATMFPYIGAAIGTNYPGSVDLPCTINANNGDIFTMTSGLVGKMPDFTLGVDGPIMGEMEFWGVIGNSMDPTTASSYFSQNTGAYANPAVPGTATLGRQEFTAAWGSFAGFTSFQAQDKWSISHELELTPITIQGRTRCFKLSSYRAMAKCRPQGPTAAQIDAAMLDQGAGAYSGSVLSGNAANLVITGSQSMTVTIGNAGMVSEGFIFGGKQLRAGEVGWVSARNISAGGSPTPALQLA